MKDGTIFCMNGGTILARSMDMMGELGEKKNKLVRYLACRCKSVEISSAISL